MADADLAKKRQYEIDDSTTGSTNGNAKGLLSRINRHLIDCCGTDEQCNEE